MDGCVFSDDHQMSLARAGYVSSGGHQVCPEGGEYIFGWVCPGGLLTRRIQGMGGYVWKGMSRGFVCRDEYVWGSSVGGMFTELGVPLHQGYWY